MLCDNTFLLENTLYNVGLNEWLTKCLMQCLNYAYMHEYCMGDDRI